MKRKFTISILEEEIGDGAEHEFRCMQAGPRLNIAIYEALREIRGRLKYESKVSKAETAFLEKLQSELRAAYIEEN